MSGRDPGEDHRASTPLELLFDLCFVVGVAQAAAQPAHGIEDRARGGARGGARRVPAHAPHVITYGRPRRDSG
ncbi:MAG: hypothetical protein EKK42_23870 [Pseudonocardiaceae bacterium]|nr:MAG: hypothetical protein EKK42_23870 [Pseudonocardiaceae bacterium]